MARKVEVSLIDDIDGAAADETVSFALDGRSYHIDLTTKRAEKFRADLARYIDAAQRVGRTRVTASTSRSARSGVAASTIRAQNQAIRAWARRKKIHLAERGRIPQHVVEQYEAAAGH
jgi:nucleoid-associated protein Lsr2